jgi:cytochrome c oxidase subunit II
MTKWTEGVLAVVIVLAFGLSMQFFVGDTPSDGGPTTTAPNSEPDPEAATRGEAVANSVGCLLCHTVDGTEGTGPTFKGLYGASRPLESGGFVTADDAYLVNSIIDPASQIVEGFPDLMPPDFGDTLSEEQVTDLVEFIKSLS